MKRFNERGSPKVESRRIQAIQILRQLLKGDWVKTEAINVARRAILKDLGLDEDDLVEVLEFLYEQAIDHDELVECGGCDHYHRPDFRGDCRNDDERFPGW